jgi:hypothetical protein
MSAGPQTVATGTVDRARTPCRYRGDRQRGGDPPSVGADDPDRKQQTDELPEGPTHRVSVRRRASCQTDC